MAAVTGGIVANTALRAGTKILGSRKTKRAQKRAAKRLAAAQRKAATELGIAGQQAEASLRGTEQEAIERAVLGAERAQEQLEPFTEPGTEAFRQVRDLIQSGRDVSGPLAESIRAGSLEAVSDPNIFDVRPEVAEQQAQLSISQLTPEIRNRLLGAAGQGIQDVGRLADVRARGFTNIGDIVGQGARRRAGLLTGQIPQLSGLIEGAQETRMLGDIAAQRTTGRLFEDLSRLGGQLFDGRRRAVQSGSSGGRSG